MAQSPPRHEDEVAQQLTLVHNALVERCGQLRAGASPTTTGN